MIEYSSAEGPEEVGRKVLAECHPELDRPQVRFVYLFNEKRDKLGIPVIPKRKGKQVWGEVKLISGLSAYLSSERVGSRESEPEPYFAVLVNKTAWDVVLKEEAQKEAFLDSLLCRCEYDLEKDKLSTREFDVREYHEVIKRRGAWHPELEKFMKVAKQMPLPGVAPPTRTRKTRAAAAAGPQT